MKAIFLVENGETCVLSKLTIQCINKYICSGKEQGPSLLCTSVTSIQKKQNRIYQTSAYNNIKLTNVHLKCELQEKILKL